MALSNSQYDSIIRIYDERQLAHWRERDARLAEVREALPAYEALEREESALFLKKADCLLDERSGEARRISEDIALIRAKKANLLSRSGYPADYLSIRYTCPHCKDTGYIDGAKCACFRQASVSLLYEQSGIRELLKQDNFDALSYEFYEGEDLTRFRNAVTTCRNFIKNFNSDYHNLFFYGTVGTGKSFLSGCVAKELIEKGNLVIYFSATRLFNELSRYAFQRENRGELSGFLDDLFQCDLLIIDDLGTELTNSFVATQLFSCLNERHIRKKATVISTNLSLQELTDRYSERIFSRIMSSYEVCKLSGPDIRMYKKRQLSRK
ncbi:MAG: ATP-binding protein [Clostridium sp.]|nr:ATP-binding protein [Clostridium sp.]